MRLLCAISLRGGADLVRRAVALFGPEPELLLLHVVDYAPRKDLERLASPLRRGPVGGPERERRLAEEEKRVGHVSLAEASREAERLGAHATTRLEFGKPGEQIVAVAREAGIDVIAISAREIPPAHPVHGPRSIGHTARFVLDHAPCDVLLVRGQHN